MFNLLWIIVPLQLAACKPVASTTSLSSVEVGDKSYGMLATVRQSSLTRTNGRDQSAKGAVEMTLVECSKFGNFSSAENLMAMERHNVDHDLLLAEDGEVKLAPDSPQRTACKLANDLKPIAITQYNKILRNLADGLGAKTTSETFSANQAFYLSIRGAYTNSDKIYLSPFLAQNERHRGQALSVDETKRLLQLLRTLDQSFNPCQMKQESRFSCEKLLGTADASNYRFRGSKDDFLKLFDSRHLNRLLSDAGSSGLALAGDRPPTVPVDNHWNSTWFGSDHTVDVPPGSASDPFAPFFPSLARNTPHPLFNPKYINGQGDYVSRPLDETWTVSQSPFGYSDPAAYVTVPVKTVTHSLDSVGRSLGDAIYAAPNVVESLQENTAYKGPGSQILPSASKFQSAFPFIVGP
jgi:hypothetical protein